VAGHPPRVQLQAAQGQRPGRRAQAEQRRPAGLHRADRRPGRHEETRKAPKENAYYYYAAVRALPKCVACHTDPNKVGDKAASPKLAAGDVMGVVRIRISTQSIEEGFHTNRAILFSFAIGTSLLIIAGSYLIIRYVIVKPVKHLKEVSEAIAAGELNIRSEIQTGDEFEDCRTRSTGCCGT
jgi:methyl-accepting chemotaxis protein